MRHNFHAYPSGSPPKPLTLDNRGAWIVGMTAILLSLFFAMLMVCFWEEGRNEVLGDVNRHLGFRLYL